MIMYFPYPYPDELVFSLIARYHIHSANKNRIQTSRDLCQPLNIPIWDGLPRKWEGFMGSIPKNWELKMDDLIQKHTVFPFYKAFLPHKTSIYIDERIFGNAINNVIPCIEFKMYPEFWRYCNHCVNEDIEIYGESYLRRTHQIPGFPICSIHGEELLSGSARVTDDNSYTIILSGSNFLSNKGFESLVSIAQDIEWIFYHMPQLKEINWSEIYQEYLLNSTNFIDAKGNIELILLSEKITEFYGETCIDFIAYEIFGHVRGVREWLQKLIYQPEINGHPVLHLLLIHFFGLTYEEFLSRVLLESGSVECEKVRI
ncbi:hypothetical protein COK19_15855 [Bacillus cereus]|uniref:TnsD family Tn7-like transposition protein n=1 Tax=Bacillus cereus TaxID=1396 RepID=UPI000BF5322C|nr:TnsD family Tn7-like transposition protein [Bacillus cereus]PFR25357.1 hypothetical protein COK19_15855 [Bacillus cereus]